MVRIFFVPYSIKMNKEIIMFDNIATKKPKFPFLKQSINISNVDIDKTMVS